MIEEEAERLIAIYIQAELWRRELAKVYPWVNPNPLIDLPTED